MVTTKSHLKNGSKILVDSISKWAYNNIETFDDAVIVGVSKYDSRLVDVLPLAVTEDDDNVLIYPAVITECPVILQGNSDGYFNIPLRLGDKVKIGYPKESAEEFFYGETSEQYVPVDTMKWNNRQAFVIGYASQFNVDKKVSTTDLELNYFDSTLSMSPDNALKYTNGSITATFNGDGTFSITGGQGTINGATITANGNVITASGSDVDEMRAQLNALNSAYNAHGTGATNHPPNDGF